MTTMTLQVPNSDVGLFKEIARKMGWILENETTPIETSQELDKKQIPDVVLSLLGAGEPIDNDDINGRKAYQNYLSEKYQ